MCIKIVLFHFNRYKEQFPDIHIGYSGHEIGFIPTLGAIALGARGMEVTDTMSYRIEICIHIKLQYNHN